MPDTTTFTAEDHPTTSVKDSSGRPKFSADAPADTEPLIDDSADQLRSRASAKPRKPMMNMRDIWI
jgi:hypothetical protein